MINAKIGINELLFITEPIDNWTASSVGYSSRVFQGIWRQTEKVSKTVAVKILRTDQFPHVLSLFHDEIVTLCLLRDIPGAAKLLAMGFIVSSQQIQLPKDLDQKNLRSLNGDLLFYNLEESEEFLNELAQINVLNFTNQNRTFSLTPFLVLKKRPFKENLLYLCNPIHAKGEILNLRKRLEVVLQVCDVLDAAYKRNIIYHDHKLSHYYFNQSLSRIHVIDWNAAKLQSKGIHQAEILMDIIKFSAHSMHYILLGCPANEIPKLGINDPERHQIYTPNWNNNEIQLPCAVRNLIIRALDGKYQSYAEIKADIVEILNDLSDARTIFNS